MSEPTKPCDLPCPKCGSADVMRSFWGKEDRRQAREYGVPIGRFSRAIAWNVYATKDHIVHHCRCCQYEWQTLPMAAKRAKEEA